jgi:hypothetical protein
MQDDKVTNLSLANTGSVAPSSHNIQITSQLSHQINNSVDANEVALWTHHPYIGPFSQLPHFGTKAQSLHFPNCSRPRDPDLAIYTFIFLGLSSALIPGGAFFSRHVQVRMLNFNFLK